MIINWITIFTANYNCPCDQRVCDQAETEVHPGGEAAVSDGLQDRVRARDCRTVHISP